MRASIAESPLEGKRSQLISTARARALHPRWSSGLSRSCRLQAGVGAHHLGADRQLERTGAGARGRAGEAARGVDTGAGQLRVLLARHGFAAVVGEVHV